MPRSMIYPVHVYHANRWASSYSAPVRIQNRPALPLPLLQICLVSNQATLIGSITIPLRPLCRAVECNCFPRSTFSMSLFIMQRPAPVDEIHPGLLPILSSVVANGKGHAPSVSQSALRDVVPRGLVNAGAPACRSKQSGKRSFRLRPQAQTRSVILGSGIEQFQLPSSPDFSSFPGSQWTGKVV